MRKCTRKLCREFYLKVKGYVERKLDIKVIDDSRLLGFIMLPGVKKDVSIHLDSSLTYEKKLYVILHEVCHLYKISTDGDFALSDVLLTEEEANEGALCLLENSLKLDCRVRYLTFYDSIK